MKHAFEKPDVHRAAAQARAAPKGGRAFSLQRHEERCLADPEYAAKLQPPPLPSEVKHETSN